MDFIAALIYITVQIAFIPLMVIGLIMVSIKQLYVSKRLGVSGMAIAPVGNRWLMDVFGIRKDRATVKLYRALPNGCVSGLWMLYFPSYLRYKISGKNKGYVSMKEEGKEDLTGIPINRTIYFDDFINKSKNKAEQFVVMGAGYDTRCYGNLKRKGLRFFELDQPDTQRLKIKCLKKAGIDISHVTFAEVNFSTDKWYEKLENAGYDPDKKSIFLWEGVTLYLTEEAVRKTLEEIREHAAAGSVILVDFYAKRLLSLKGVSATREGFHFALDFFDDRERILEEFIKSENLSLGGFKFMGQKTKKGAIGVVAEVLI